MQVIKNNPTRDLVVAAIADELQLRQASFPEVDCHAVLRYGGFVGSTILTHQTLPRAMEFSRTYIEELESRSESVPNGLVILADTMTRSKGRFTRVWHAPEGGVWGCLVHANTLMDSSKQFVPLAIGLACCETVRVLGGSDATLRWVNDVIFGEKKVAGFLVEGYNGPYSGEEFHLVGFGININNEQFPDELSSIATSLSKELGENIDLTQFTTLFLAKLAWNFGLLYYEEARELRGLPYSGSSGKHLLLENWLGLTDCIGQRVKYGFDVITNPQYEATVVGLEPDGGLKMRFDDDFEKVEHSGEIRYL